MTTSQTIDGVSRALLERSLNAAEWQKIDFDRSESPFRSEIASTVKELRALLDKPDTPYTPKGEWSFEYIDGGDIVIRNGEDWTLIKRGDGPIYEQFLYRFCEEQLKPAAQPQGEVERLQRRCENAELALKYQTSNCDTLRAQLAERDVLLHEWVAIPRAASSSELNKVRCKTDHLLSTSAEPKPRGEVVAWMDPICLERMGRQPERNFVVTGQCKSTYSVPLYAEQPAPVAVAHRCDCNGRCKP